jgi:hypothetical protein
MSLVSKLPSISLAAIGCVVLLRGDAYLVHAQNQLPTEIPQLKFSRGQSVVPYFEGWIRNPDGTFDLVFGYFNRNWEEELAIPPGPDNSVEPGGPDRGQPTYFVPRRQGWIFRVQVPKDFGKNVLTWTLTAHGRTEKAYGELLPVEEITERIVMTRGNLNPGEADPNKPPSLAIAPIPAATLTAPVTLTATVTDDGLPKPRPVPPTRTEPGAAGTSGFPRAQANSSTARPRGLTLIWLQYRGPAKATFADAGAIPVTDGTATTVVRFSEAGAYELRATASDGALSTKAAITINVTR